MSPVLPISIDAVLFDFGGVLAEEGFLNGFHELATGQNLDPEKTFWDIVDIVYRCGYLVGRGDEAEFWELVRRKTGLQGANETFRRTILSGFKLRPGMFELIKKLRKTGVKVAILSDQTNWLDELEGMYDFFQHFDVVFNSYHTGFHKREPGSFLLALNTLGTAPENTLFVDDSSRNVAQARELGIRTIHFEDPEAGEAELIEYFPALAT